MLRTFNEKQIEKIKKYGNLIQCVISCTIIAYLNSLHSEKAHIGAWVVCFTTVGISMLNFWIQERKYKNDMLKRRMMNELTQDESEVWDEWYWR